MLEAAAERDGQPAVLLVGGVDQPLGQRADAEEEEEQAAEPVATMLGFPAQPGCVLPETTSGEVVDLQTTAAGSAYTGPSAVVARRKMPFDADQPVHRSS